MFRCFRVYIKSSNLMYIWACMRTAVSESCDILAEHMLFCPGNWNCRKNCKLGAVVLVIIVTAHAKMLYYRDYCGRMHGIKLRGMNNWASMICTYVCKWEPWEPFHCSLIRVAVRYSIRLANPKQGGVQRTVHRVQNIACLLLAELTKKPRKSVAARQIPRPLEECYTSYTFNTT